MMLGELDTHKAYRLSKGHGNVTGHLSEELV